MTDFNQIKEAVVEAKGILLGGRIDKVWNLDDYTFLFAIYNKRTTYSLVISVLKRSKRFHLVFDTIKKDYLFTSFVVDIFKSHLLKGKIFHTVLYEGFVELKVFRQYHYTLIIDFRTCNIILIDDNAKILFALHKRSLPDLRNEEIYIHLATDDKSTSSSLPINEALSREFIAERNDILRRSFLKIIKSEERKVKRLIDKLLIEEDEINRKDQYRELGDLIKYNLGLIPKGKSSVLVLDFNGDEIKVDLDPKLSPHENMDLYFKRYKKLKRKEKGFTQKVEYERERLKLLLEFKNEVTKGSLIGLDVPPHSSLNAYDLSFIGRGFKDRLEKCFYNLKGVRQSAVDRTKRTFLQFISESGKVIMVGRNARENEELSVKVARGNDMWFHVEAGTGSHVILRYDKKAEFQKGDIRDACILALYFSKMRNEKGGNIVYTYCKYVKKPKRSKMGYVTYYNNKTKYITLDEDVLKRLRGQ